MSNFSKALTERFLLQEEYLGNNKPINIISPLVSVTITTYQHKDYIRQCLDGILMQKTTFPFEIIIGEDGSTDGTQEICKEYAEKYPDQIRLFLRDRKLSQFQDTDGKIKRFNGIWNRMSCRGKYIAWCEGDDFWIDPLKLQKQVDFLESNPDYGLSCTDVNVYNQTTDTYSNFFFKKKNWNIKYTFEDFLINGWFLAPCTWVFRTEFVMGTIDNDFCVGDLPILLEISSRSKVKYLSESTAVYRVLSNSASHGFSFAKQVEFRKGVLHIQLYYLDKCKKQHLKRKILCRWLLVMSKISFNYHKYKFMTNCIIKYFLYCFKIKAISHKSFRC